MNLLLAWADRTDLLAATLVPYQAEQVLLDPLDQARIGPAITRSQQVQAGLQSLADQRSRASCMVLHTVRNDASTNPVAHRAILEGTPSIGVAFWEHANNAPEVAGRLRTYPLVIAGSTWNQQILRDAGAPCVQLVLQGVDTSHFHPAPKRGIFPGRFVVLSGGKLEYRKGQDLVLRAFRLFARDHPDALLLTAWSSPWPELARGLGAKSGVNPALEPPPFTTEGQFDARAWTQANGIPDRQVFHCGSLPNYLMPRILREADVAVFPNRAEGGTNLVAMECMACAVPVLLSANTGHLDLLRSYKAIPLEQQTSIPTEEQAADHSGWGESNVDEIIAALETLYIHRESAQARASHAAAQIAHLTWTAQMNKLADLLLPLRPGN
jgi:glycosyltransferase involved in cell wall biosynthesis